MNSQMSRYFYEIDEFLSEMFANDTLQVFDELDMDELAELSMEQIKKDFEAYCLEGALALKIHP